MLWLQKRHHTEFKKTLTAPFSGAVRGRRLVGSVHLFRRHKQSSSRKLSARVVSRAGGREPTTPEARRTCSEYGRVERSPRYVRARLAARRHRDRRQFCARVLREQRASAAAAAETRCVVYVITAACVRADSRQYVTRVMRMLSHGLFAPMREVSGDDFK